MNPEHHRQLQDPEHTPDTSPHQAAAPLREAPKRQSDRDRERNADADLTPAEREEKDKILAETTAALTTVYDRLQTEHDLTPAKVEAALDTAPPLNTLPPAYSRHLETVISTEQLQHNSQEEFIHRGLAVLDLWIHIQGLKRGADRDLEALRGHLRQVK